ncbi:glycosyltransferase family 4 protein [Streptococcus sp. CSL10205-OR2]|uniref:glycosyltransferase family 4 protein n=1 Tax=Streptococcus sp. CSL10205-OR2 TaxID=2980558 RepID=UPI0021D9FABE|nr:glycosyltransferase family 4 protein [Streptococcus sp. CSL10205-OR2]MCU9533610.1 glycosyltransferase family 4 protein [Streptococcus sp. CSL10205-OR2]
MKKLLFYVNSMNAYGGIERVISNLANSLVDNFEITILVKDNPISSYPLNPKIKIESLDTALVMDMSSRLKRIFSVPVNIVNSVRVLKKYFKTHHFDLVYTAYITNGLEIYLAEKNLRKKLVASEHASYYAYNSVYQRMKTFLYPRLKIISVPTTMDTEIYQNKGYHAVYIPHLSTFSASPLVSKDTKTIINVGRLTSDKQQQMLLEIWQLVNQKLPEHHWKLQIIGSGEEENHLKNFARSNKIANVSFIPHTSKITDYYQKAELFVFTSKMEGFGMVLLEAMSFGVPCISFDSPSGPRDIVKDENNGYLIPCYDKELFANRICEFITKNNNDKEQMKKAALDTIINWDNDAIIQKWLNVFNDLEKN